MARTKQTARKSTSGAAPRRQLAGLHHRSYHSLKYSQLPSHRHTLTSHPINSSTSKASKAQDKVLSTPDLLIIILSQLPHSSLLKAKLVNKTWASLFGNVEIQAALFVNPRPKESAMYTEMYSDLLTDRWADFWSVSGVHEDEEDSDGEESEKEQSEAGKPDRVESDGEGLSEAVVPKGSIGKRHHPKEHVKTDGRGRITLELRLSRHSDSTDTPHPWQWRQLLFCQPPVEILEIVQQINRRSGPTLEFRTTIHRPGGLRMGFLYDSVRYWHEVERSSVELLWDRKTGDLVDEWNYYIDGDSFKTEEDKPCVTIWGKTSVGCGQYGGLTYESYGPPREGQARKARTRYIKSGDEQVAFQMSEPRAISYDLSFLSDPREEEEGDEEEED
ncbi:hypothetical protein BKA64DRAFT_652369 [Cadophora sp. MPI-SDFR-AT-0126]|nr:hypothetical protein BKA64DRAFT_652369 [Leotiomycetes sp. MPI-SDFR-AT-0126]